MRLRLITAAMAAGVALAAAAPATAQEAEAPAAAVDAETRRTELARQYIGLMDLERLMREQIDGMVDMAGDLAVATAPKGSTQAAPIERFTPEATGEAMDEMYALILPMLTEVMVTAHAQVFSEAELEALIGFFGAPVGQDIMNKQAELNLVVMETMIERLPEWVAQMEGQWDGVTPDSALGETGSTKLYGT